MHSSILVGLLGQGVGPSLTPPMHEREAARQGLRYIYRTVDLDGDRLDPGHVAILLRAAVELGFDGLNVTHPIKQVVVPMVDRVSEDVAAIGALNTVLIRDRETIGHNTDVTGFAGALAEGLPGADLTDVVLLGAGGAGTAVAHALVRLGAGRVSVFDLDAQHAAALVESAGSARPAESGRPNASAQPASSIRRLEPVELAGAVRAATGLVNATPVGMAHHPGLPLPADLLHPGLWVTDIVYRPLLTELVRAARAAGCRVLSGAGMAVHQAAEAFELITGRPADRAAMARDLDEMVGLETGSTGPSLAPVEQHP